MESMDCRAICYSRAVCYTGKINMLRIGLTLLVLSAVVILSFPAVSTESQLDVREQSPLNQQIAGFSDPAFIRGIPRDYPRSESQWLNKEKQRYQDLLATSHYDLMVVPFQVHGFALDRPTRSLMTAQLSYALAKGTGLKLPDPYLLARALGEGERQYDVREVMRLAKRLGVKNVVWAHVGHNRKQRMNLYVQELPPDSRPQINFKHSTRNIAFSDIAFSDHNPPIEVYQSLLPEVLRALGVNKQAEQIPAAHKTVNITLPETPKALFSGNSQDPVKNAYYFQFLAYLTPEYAERTRERFVEKSLLAVQTLPPDHTAYRALKARAYLLLGLRPAALHFVADPGDSEEAAIRAVLNGNLPQLREAAEKIADGVPRYLAEMDANLIAGHYKVISVRASAEMVKSLKLSDELWQFLIVRAMADWNVWTQFNNSALKQLLDREFPIQGFTAQTIIGGGQALGEVSAIQSLLDVSVEEHIGMLFGAGTDEFCCTPTPGIPGPGDYIDLIAGTATDNLFRRADYLLSVQGSPSMANDYLVSLATMYAGHPRFAYARAATYAALAGKRGGDERESLLKKATLDKENAIFWSRGQTRVAAKAFWLSVEMQRFDYGYADNPYVADHPFRTFYPTWEDGGNPNRMQANSFAILANATYRFTPIQKLSQELDDDPKLATRFIKALKGRFSGNAEYLKFMADRSLATGNHQEAEQYLRQAIQVSPSTWGSYEQLGILLVENGHVEQAYQLFISWPGFHEDSNQNRVLRANAAYLAGSLFYWMGYFDFSTPLYRLSANLKTGSEGGMASGHRLDNLDGNFELAAQGMLNRAQRYNSSYAYRDYLGLIHATGQSQQAWDAFRLLINHHNKPHVWQTALVGHRLASSSEVDITAWAQNYKDHISITGESHAAIYLLRAGVVDRIPTEQLAQQIQGIASPIWRMKDAPKHVFRDAPETGLKHILGPIVSKFDSVLPLGFANRSEYEPAKSDLVYFADAYRALQQGKPAQAASTLEPAIDQYNLAHDRFAYLLPYYTFAAIRAGKTMKVEKKLDELSRENQRFDYHLAKAIVAGLAGDTGNSQKHLDLAKYRRPHTESRPLFTEYQYAEIIELIYEATGEPVYKQRLLDWVGKAQQFFPWYSWTYAMQAKHTDSAQQRDRAIVICHYLDEDSERLNDLPQAQIQAALKNQDQFNPFVGNEATEPAGPSI